MGAGAAYTGAGAATTGALGAATVGLVAKGWFLTTQQDAKRIKRFPKLIFIPI